MTGENVEGSSSVVETVEKFDLMLGPTRYLEKPPKSENPFIAINREIARSPACVSLPELTEAITQGRTFAPAVFRDEQRTSETWVQQQLFALDYDNDKPGNCLTPDIFLERCETLGIRPAFMYPSFRHTEEMNKFRAVFVNDTVITDSRLRKMILLTLMDVFTFDECAPDPNCKDAARVFLGTNKQLLHEDYTQRINPIQVFQARVDQLRERTSDHFSRDLKRFCERVGVAYASPHDIGVKSDGYDYAVATNSIVPPLDQIQEDVGGSVVSVLYYYTNTVKPPTSLMVAVAPDVDTCVVKWCEVIYLINFSRPVSNTTSSPHHPRNTRGQTGSSNVSSPFPLRRLDDTEKATLLEKCQLVREFMNGDRKCDHIERRRLFTNLRLLVGGENWFNEGLLKRDDYTPDTLVRDIKFYNHHPEGCRRCAYDDNCDHKTNLLQQLPIRRRECRQIKDSPQRMPLETTRDILVDVIGKVMATQDKKVFVIKCDTGVGKTNVLLQQNLDGVCVAFDTHRLKTEAYARLRQQGRDAYLWQQPPLLPMELAKMLQRYHEIGLGGTVKTYQLALEDPSVSEDPDWSADIHAYLKSLSDVHVQSSLFTTHEKAYQLQGNSRLHTFVFDEDFTKTLIRVGEVTRADLTTFRDKVRELNDDKYADIGDHLKAVFHAPAGITHMNTPESTSLRLVLEVLLKMPTSFTSPIAALFSCNAYRKDSANPGAPESIYCISQHILRQDRKYVILSATANEQVYRMLFGDRLVFMDLSGTELKGRLYCHTRHSYSKQSIAQDQEAFSAKVVEDKTKYGFEGIITHKFCASENNGELWLTGAAEPVPVFGTFGGLQGLDSFGGRNIAVYGTPYPPEYVVKLWAALLGLTSDEDMYRFAERPVEWEEYEIHVPTCSDNPQLQRIHLWLAQTEIVQAVGRARLVDNDCTVHVFAKLPVSGCALVE